MGHTRTDPACRDFRPPRFWWQRWLFDRARGRACPVCAGSDCRYGFADCDCQEADR